MSLTVCVLTALTAFADGASFSDRAEPIRVSSSMKIERLVIKFVDNAEMRMRNGKLAGMSGKSIAQVDRVLADHQIERLFQRSEAALDDERRSLRDTGTRAPVDKNSYYQIKTENIEQAQELVNQLVKLAIVETAYLEPEPEPAQDIPPPTPDFSGSQGYLYDPPGGIGASYCWSIPGGAGEGVNLIDIEGNWNRDHEDFDDNYGTILAGEPVNLIAWINHGTATTGEICGDSNEYGITGIAHDAYIDLVSTGNIGFAAAVDIATTHLQPGDVIFIELHTPGPRYNFETRADQLGYVPMEYFKANFDAVQMASAKGIIVVAAAGNGQENLDDPLYEGRFDRSIRDSRAILVGAGAPPNGLFGPDRTRLDFSNYGSRVDLQGWGESVATTGYGDLFDGDIDFEQYYTEVFAGTSAATPIVAGAVACLQGIYKQQYGIPMTIETMTSLLTNTGSQQPNPTEWIGPRPNIEFASQVLPSPGITANPLFIEAEVFEGGTVYDMVRLTNEDVSSPIDFDITTIDDIEGLAPADWIDASPTSGTIPAGGFIDILLTFDSGSLFDTTYNFKGMLEVDYDGWSDLLIPVFFDVLCVTDEYDVFESDNNPPRPFSWVDITETGIVLEPEDFHNVLRPNSALDDGTSIPIPIGFPFNFYNSMFTTIYAGVNGGLSFVSDEININGYFADLALPSPGLEALLLPFWNDLSIDSIGNGHGEIYYYNSPDNDSFVIEYHQIGNFGHEADSMITFEIILTSDYTITYQYLDVGIYDLALNSLVGVSRDQGCRYVAHFSNFSPPSHVPHDSLRIDFVPAYTISIQSGDADGSGEIDIDDVVFLIDYIFLAGPAPVPVESGDCNCSGYVDIDDIVYLVTFIFAGGSQPCMYEP